MDLTVGFLVFVFLFGACAADWMNLTKIRIQLMYELRNDLQLPSLGTIDRILRNGKKELNGWFSLQLFVLPLLGLLIFRWYFLFLIPSIYFFGYIVSALILPEPFTQFYVRRTIRAVKNFLNDGQQFEIMKSEIERLAGLWNTESGKRAIGLIWKGPLSSREREAASMLDVYLVWYDDRYEQFSETPSSFLHAVCLTREEAEKLVARRPLHGEGSWDGYDMSGPSNLLNHFVEGFVSLEQVRQLLRGESPTGPKYN